MSFRDVRDLTEQLKLLGFTENIPISLLNTSYGSLESFKVYASILKWLIGRLEPGATVPGNVETENDRIIFIRSVSEFLVIKAGIKVNPRKLYASSAATAKEILKITSVLIVTPETSGKDDEEIRSLQEIDLSDKVDDLRRARELSSELTKRGATLYDLLTKEQINKEIRSTQASRPLELASVERTLKNAITSLENKVASSKSYLETTRTEKNNLNAKLQRKSAELERSKQRLQALQKVRPAFLEDFERYEQELKSLYEQYIIRIRCVDSLKSQLAARESDKAAERSSPIAKITDGSMTMLPEGLIDSDDEEDEDPMENGNLNLKEELETSKPANREELLHRARSSTRLRGRTGVAVRGGDNRVIGSMTDNGDLDNLDSSLGSDDTESELDLNGGDLGNLGSLHSDDESLAKLTRETNLNSNHRGSKLDLSDEDF
uniref:CSON007902 protein n=1 Tax=Culicoides sonorensis TaxID=179676 RepID=A0A336MVG7_CULSO